MNNDIFNQRNQLNGVRICLNGTFSIETKRLNKMLKDAGVSSIDRVSTSRKYKEGETISPTKEGTNLYVLGKNPNEDSIKRYELNVHDGFKALLINEEQLMQLLAGTSALNIPKTIEKQIDLTFDYINWEAPTINDKTFVSRLSSPLKYDMDENVNCIYMKEIFVPDFPNTNMQAFRQIIGNYGGYANSTFYDDTNIIMLSQDTLEKLEKGIKDKVIIDIENKYNSGSSKIFNVQFTTEKDFLAWVNSRIMRFPDEATIQLLKNL